MQFKLYCTAAMKSLVLSSVLFAVGCYERPSAERLDFDPDVVQTLRQEIESVDWDE